MLLIGGIIFPSFFARLEDQIFTSIFPRSMLSLCQVLSGYVSLVPGFKENKHLRIKANIPESR